ncbi:hypothetical protein ASPZODRAFT_285558 [Penicilliopsis zonata CBS 506.65]|uniref:Uncharacterized protein n=1 Tax=Penicilliopsis zonata CBS 506.65 TaxID=1073090 RepID=A0A1L9SUV0_9EURO|nr:hypothetical protein ASPZODRAFT_285558 [Penicilliopsis zonata CBS 506.65]OJJ50916.1 hypothetical protein ASPZODRAFT_285558 [Penicilliopsis zonata CBS 506.65]
MATLVVQQQTLRHATPPPLAPALTLSPPPTVIPNKHLPVCPTGPVKAPLKAPLVLRDSLPTPSLLYPPDAFPRASSVLPVYSIDAETLRAAVDLHASQPLPDPSLMFPWLHGLHPENQIQLAFFVHRRRSLRRSPKCWRGITIVKAGGNLATARLKGAIAPEEILTPSGIDFLIADPPQGFSVRNFQIQTAKLAPMSDIVVYGGDDVSQKDILTLAEQIAIAQQNWRIKFDGDREVPLYNTFVVSNSFRDIEKRCPSLIAFNTQGQMTGQVVDFFHCERLEMCTMAKASEISTNVWQGPTPDHLLRPSLLGAEADDNFDLLVEASDVASMPGTRLLATLSKQLAEGPQRLEFPSSGSIVASGDSRETDSLVNTLRWLYSLANPHQSPLTPDLAADTDVDADGDIPMVNFGKKPCKILIHCADGYTESSLLTIAYYMFAHGVPAHEAWLKLHCDQKRNFFAYPTDVEFLKSIQARVLQESPAAQAAHLTCLPDPVWFAALDGSLPSRILPYMYLGNLAHANNAALLWELGIRRVLSIGEAVSWTRADLARFGVENLMYIGQVQDNGIDPLTQEFAACLDFIRRGKQDGGATLVHCRVGVSRSATICIAEVMATMGLSFPRAYCYVRARRLNVIIQPHLRFQLEKQNKPIKRDLEWPTIAREIALMNKPYSR